MPTNTQNREKLNINPEVQSGSVWSEAARTVDDLRHDPTLIERLQESGIDPADQGSIAYSEALLVFAEDYCDTREKEGLLEPHTAQRVKLLASTPLFMSLSNNVRGYESDRRERRLSNDEWQDYNNSKEYLVWFNQSLSGYIEKHPDEKMSDLQRSLTDEALKSLPADAESIERTVSDVTRGARTETVFKQILDLANIPYSSGSIDDDLRGGDVIIHYNNRRIKVDIKSSLEQILEIRNREGIDPEETKTSGYVISRDRRDRNNLDKQTIVLYAGFTDQELGDRLSLSEEEVQAKAMYPMVQLQRALNEMGV